MEKAIVSMVRLSSAFALYGIDQLQTAISPQGGTGVATNDFRVVLDSMTESLQERMGQSNRDAVKSTARIVERVVEQSLEGLSLMDPRRVLRVANNLVQKSSEVMFNWSGNEEPIEDKPELAVEVLTSPGH